jgi:predicted permease
MEWLRFWRRDRKDSELARELDAYVELETEANMAAGLPRAQARAAAMRKLGNTARVREAVYDMHSVPWLDPFCRDLTYAARQLRRQPAFTIAAVLSLALGIGANLAIFQLLYALSLRHLPVAAPDELVEVRLVGDGRAGRHTGRNRQLSWPQWKALERRQQAFSNMFAFGDTRFNLAPLGEVRYVEGLWVSGGFFSTLGLTPVAGRFITEDDDRPGCGYPGAVVSHTFWQRELGGRPDAIGRLISVGPAKVPVLGVAPPGFFGVEVGLRFAVALPICSAEFDRRDHWWLAAIGRLRRGWTREQAEAHLHSVLRAVQEETLPTTYRGEATERYLAMRVEVVDASAGVSPMRGSYQRPLWVLMATAALVLLIASVNLTNLLLARATVREREFAIRLAIGGSKARVLQQVLVESLALALLGLAVALVFSAMATRSVLILLSTMTDAVFLDLSPDWRLSTFAVVLAVCTALGVGLGPAVRATRATTLTTNERGAVGNRAHLTVRRTLVAVQVAFTLVLLFGAALFARSLQNLATTDTGLRSDGVLTANVFFRESAYPPERRSLAYADLEERLRTLPGLTGVADTSTPPLGGSFWDTTVRIDGREAGRSNVNQVGGRYFDVVGVRLIAGRPFDGSDSPSSEPVAIVNDAFALKYLDGSAVGRTVQMQMPSGVPGTAMTVIGVVQNHKHLDLREPFPPILYLPSSQDRSPGLTRRYILHSTDDPARAQARVRTALVEFDPDISVRFARLDDQIGEQLLQEGLLARLSGLFGAVAFVLALVGVYGVVAYAAAGRRSEIGVRMALGAGRAAILRMMLGEVVRVIALGLAFGCLGAWFAGRAIGGLLYGLDAGDVPTMAFALTLLSAAGLVAALLPARRAAMIDPVQALRE